MPAEATASPPIVLGTQCDNNRDASKSEITKPTGLNSPPDSNNALLDGSDSELSDLDDFAPERIAETTTNHAERKSEEMAQEDEVGEITPDHYSNGVPVFKPTMHQFKDFKVFMNRIDQYGMKSGIVKVIPPSEWREAQPQLHELVKQIRVRDPIKQEIMGSNGTYRQMNILHQRAYNLPQWRQLCDQSEHQPPARRGERRANAEKPKTKPSTRSRPVLPATNKPAASKAKRGRPPRKAAARAREDTAAESEDRPLTPTSPRPGEDICVPSVEHDNYVQPEDVEDEEEYVPAAPRRMGGITKPKTQSTSARRKYIRREGSAMIDESAFKDFDYHMDVSDFTPERCEELERTYWRTLTYAPPLYGADLPGTLFDDSADIWNLNKLPNLLDVLGTKVPGVNTAYLYLGMWKATFAWHLEDVDLYSINYLHFGAPKQWYSIAQGDARRFEAAMKNLWPTEAKACDQFLRHKGFLISPAHLKQHYNITVNKCVSYPGEFVVTYPYGYHSGYNLGYNCAEAVNFALDSWLPMGKIAKRCQCAQAQDSVWVDVYEIERKLRGESTEYEETDDEAEEDEESENENEEGDTGLSLLTGDQAGLAQKLSRKRKRASGEATGARVKKIRLRSKARPEPPCCLCPNDYWGIELLPTDDGRKAHRMCALYVPETYIDCVDNQDVVVNVAGVDKARLDLKCLFCRSKMGACFQCSQKKCARSYHATCAAAAGVFVEDAEVPVLGEDGIEYKEQAFEFSCRFHRMKRDKKLDGAVLENRDGIRTAAAALRKGDICQMQFHKGDIFAGVVVANHHDEHTITLDVVPGGDRMEVEWKWLLLPDASDLRLPRASANALPMPTTKQAKDKLKARRPANELPRKDEPFVEGFVWADFQRGDMATNAAQVAVDLSRQGQMWHYLGRTSTEARAQYTNDPAKPLHDVKSNFLDSLPKRVGITSMPPPPPPARLSRSPAHSYQFSFSSSMGPSTERPYVYKPRAATEMGLSTTSYVPQRFIPLHSPQPLQWHGQAPHLSSRDKPDSRHDQSGNKNPAISGKASQSKNPSPSSFAGDRFAPVGGSNGFPQLPGLTRAPAHLNSGHTQSPFNAWSSPKSTAHAFPMGVISPSSQVRPMVTYQKYSFFQVHHNRDSTVYRSPYASGVGFANGYAGNFRNFMLKARHSLSGGGLRTTPLLQQHHDSRASQDIAGRSSSFEGRRLAYSNRHSGSPHTASEINEVSNTVSQLGAALHPAIRPRLTATAEETSPNISHAPVTPDLPNLDRPLAQSMPLIQNMQPLRASTMDSKGSSPVLPTSGDQQTLGVTRSQMSPKHTMGLQQQQDWGQGSASHHGIHRGVADEGVLDSEVLLERMMANLKRADA